MSRSSWILVGVMFVAGVLWARDHQKQGEIRQQLKVAERAYDSLAREGAKLDTVYVHRVDTLRRVRVVTDSILARDTLTFVRVDTVKQIVQAERRACDAVVQTCEAQKAILGQQIGNLTDQLRLERRKKPSRFGCAGPAAVNTKGFGLGIACGVKF